MYMRNHVKNMINCRGVERQRIFQPWAFWYFDYCCACISKSKQNERKPDLRSHSLCPKYWGPFWLGARGRRVQVTLSNPPSLSTTLVIWNKFVIHLTKKRFFTIIVLVLFSFYNRGFMIGFYGGPKTRSLLS